MSTSNGARKGKAAAHSDDAQDDVEMGSANGDDQEEDEPMEDDDGPVELDAAILKKRKTRADFRELHADIEGALPFLPCSCVAWVRGPRRYTRGRVCRSQRDPLRRV